MKFNIVLGNHPASGINTIRDHTLIIQGGLRDAGHRVQLSFNDVFHDQINIFYDFFNRDSVDYFRDLRASRYEYALITTEIVQGDTLNYTTNDGIRERIAATKEIAQNARFVWVMHEPSLANFKALCAHDRCFFLPLGYTQMAHELRHIPYVDRDIDFLFFGYLTDYRRVILDQLSKTKYIVKYIYNVPGFIRNSMIERTKINMSLRQTSTWDQPSVGRISYLVTNQCAIICDQTANGAPYENYTLTASARDFADACVHMISTDEYQHKARILSDQFKCELPLDAMYHDLLARTFS